MPRAVSESAGTLWRTLVRELAGHGSDEDHSLAPRLRRAGGSGALLLALEVLANQHRDVQAVVGRVAPLWQRLEQEPGALTGLAPRLADSTDRLAAIFSAHLSLEESLVFPAARRLLEAEDLQSMARELRERREGGSGR